MDDMESATNVEVKLKKKGFLRCRKRNTVFAVRQLWIASFFAIAIILVSVVVYRLSNLSEAVLPTEPNDLFAFGLGISVLSPILPVVTLVLSMTLFCLKTRYSTIGASMILIGGISNVLERLTIGHVNDYLSFFGLWSFNLADILISVGAFVIILGLIWKQER